MNKHIDKGRVKGKNTVKEKVKEKHIDEAIDESFPASDPPSWTMGEPKENVDNKTGHREPESKKKEQYNNHK